MQIEIEPTLKVALIKAEGASCLDEIIVRLVNARAAELGLLERLPPARLVESDGERLRKALFDATPEDFGNVMKLNSPGW